MATPIEDYALIGDCETAALVGRNGSIDWLCWPRFDSGAVFARAAGHAGQRSLADCRRPDPKARTARRYRGDTLILETQIETADGAVTLIDFMPLRGQAPDIVRLVCGRHGRRRDEHRVRDSLRLRFHRSLGHASRTIASEPSPDRTCWSCVPASP